LTDPCYHYTNAKTLAHGAPGIRAPRTTASSPTNRAAPPTDDLLEPPTRDPLQLFHIPTLHTCNGSALHRCTSARRSRLLVQANPHNCPLRRAATWLLPVCIAHFTMARNSTPNSRTGTRTMVVQHWASRAPTSPSSQATHVPLPATTSTHDMHPSCSRLAARDQRTRVRGSYCQLSALPQMVMR